MNAIRRSAAVLAAGALLALAACGGENPATRPVELKEPTWDIGSEPSDGGGKSDGGGEPTKAAPDIPPPDPKDFPGMDQKTDEGAEQATRYYIQIMFWAQQTDGVDRFSQLFRDSCENCASILEHAVRRRDAKRFWSKVETKIHECDQVYSSPTEKEFHCNITIGPHSEASLDDGSTKNHGPLDMLIAVNMKWDHRGWLAAAYGSKRVR